MPQFRTIEEFVLKLEGLIVNAESEVMKYRQKHDVGGAKYWRGKIVAWQDVLEILRTSNLGIVHPPSEDDRSQSFGTLLRSDLLSEDKL